MNKFYIIGASFVTLLHSSTSLLANIGVMTQSHLSDSDLGMSFIAVKSRSSEIQDAARAASAAYNDAKDVSKKMRLLSTPVGHEERDELAKDHKVVNFSATDPLHGIVPAGIITYKETDSGKAQIIVAFHGSECIEDFTEANLLLHSRKNPDLGIDGKIHGGFHDRYMQSRTAMIQGIMKQLADHGKDVTDVDFIVTGHSLGGALATLAASDLKKNVASDTMLNLITFSSPRVVNSTGAKSIETLLGSNRIIRIWRDKDPVPLSLLGILGYKHVGQSTKLKSGTDYVDLKNHDLGSIRADALKSDEVEILEHEGYRSWMMRKVVSAPRIVANFLKRSVSGLFSRS